MVLRGAVGGFDSPALPFVPGSRNLPASHENAGVEPPNSECACDRTAIGEADALAAFVEAAATLAAKAAAAGDLRGAHRLLARGLEALGVQGLPASLKLVAARG